MTFRQALLNFAACQLLLVMFVAQDAHAQLPPTNLGKFVHQPGENQYTPETQTERHPPVQHRQPARRSSQSTNPSAAASSAPVPYKPVHIAKPDISLDPIAADEPVIPPGFPPFPDRVELPGINVANSMLPSVAPSGSRAAPAGDFHQHYRHMSMDELIPASAHQSHGYYKSAPAPDIYSANGHAGAGKQQPATASLSPAERELQAMKKEPAINNRLDKPTPPDAPTALNIRQAVTQDLSLSDDDFSYKPQTTQPPSAGKQMLKNMGRQLMMPLYMAPSMATGRLMHF